MIDSCSTLGSWGVWNTIEFEAVLSELSIAVNEIVYFSFGFKSLRTRGDVNSVISLSFTNKNKLNSLSKSSTSQLIVADSNVILSKVNAFKNLGGSVSTICFVVIVKVLVVMLLFKSDAIKTTG